MKFLKILFILLFIFVTKSIALENKIIFKIENDIITTIDILNEINNLKFFNKNLNQLSDQEIYQIATQSITRHKIKKYEVIKILNDLDLNDENYINTLIEQKSKELGYEKLEDFKKELINKNVDFNYYKEKLKVNIFWNQIIFTKYNDKIIIKEDEIKKKLQNEKKKNYILSFKLKEIVFQTQDSNEIQTKYEFIKNDIEKLGFESAALKYSVSMTANDGGNLGWVDEGAINKILVNELKTIKVKEITKPIRISSGFLILQKYDEKKIEQKIEIEKELKRLIDYERNQQLNNYSNLFYNKIKNNLKISAP